MMMATMRKSGDRRMSAKAELMMSANRFRLRLKGLSRSVLYCIMGRVVSESV